MSTWKAEFEADEDDVEIEHFARFDRIWVDDDLVAKVFGREVGFDGIFLV